MSDRRDRTDSLPPGPSPTPCSTRGTCSTRTGLVAQEPGSLAVRRADPRAFSEADGSERWSMRTECLVDPRPRHPCCRCGSGACRSSTARSVEAAELRSDAALFARWSRSRSGGERLRRLGRGGRADGRPDLAPVASHSSRPDRRRTVARGAFAFAGGTEIELIVTSDGVVAGRIVRQPRNCRRVGWSSMATTWSTEGGPLREGGRHGGEHQRLGRARSLGATT